jgi:hypothetical protein
VSLYALAVGIVATLTCSCFFWQLIGKYTNTTDVTKVRDIKATIKRVERFKASGNDLFHNKKYDEALHQYSSGLEALKPFSNVKFRVTLLANKVAALMALGR